MKNIFPNTIYSVTALAETHNFPASYLLDDHPKKKFKSSQRTDTLTMNIGAGSSGIMIGNTNAESVDISINGADVLEFEEAVEWEAATEWEQYASTTLATIDLSASTTGVMWAEYAEMASAHEAHITLTSPVGTTLYAGVLKGGPVNTFSDPHYGIKEGEEDYSLLNKLNNGATYTKDKDVARTFSATGTQERNPDFYALMNIFKQAKKNPIPWRISTNSDGLEWVVYARKDGSPEGDHDHDEHTVTTFNLIEVL